MAKKIKATKTSKTKTTKNKKTTKTKTTAAKKPVHRKHTELYRVRYISYREVKATPAFKKDLLKKIDYTLSFGKKISKTQKQLIKNIKNAKTSKTIVRNLQKLWATDYGLFKKQKSEPGIGFIGKKSRDIIERNNVIRDNTILDFQDEENLNSEAEVLLYLKREYQQKVINILAEYDIYDRADLNWYPDRARRAQERVQNDIRALADVSFDDILFIAF